MASLFTELSQLQTNLLQGVTMPGLTVVDGTPRDCPSAGCGAQDDTAVIRANELGTAKASALGRSKADGPITATKMMAVFMNGAAGNVTAREIHEASSLYRRQLFGGSKAAVGSVKTPGNTLHSHDSVSEGLTLCSWNLRDRSSSMRGCWRISRSSNYIRLR